MTKKEYHRLYNRRWYKTHKQSRNETGRRYNKRLKATVIGHYGGKRACPGCKETNMAFLTIDHIKGGGTRHRRNISRGNGFYLWLIRHKFPKGFQVLCFNCNFGKWANGGICPHNG